MCPHLLVVPFAFSMHVNQVPVADQSVLWFDDREPMNITCEIYSYPRCRLQLISNGKIVNGTERIDCVNDDRSTIVASDASCLLQSNWRIRVRIDASLRLAAEHNIACAALDFPRRETWNRSLTVSFRRRAGRHSSM